MKTGVKAETILADLILAAAMADNSEPEKGGRGWKTDELVQLIDSTVIGKYGDPDAFCDVVLQLHSYMHRPEVGSDEAIWPGIMLLRGTRLLSLNEYRRKSILGLYQQVKEKVDYLPDCPKKWRLLSLICYHMAVFHNDCGEYDKAAEFMGHSAKAASGFGDCSGIAIAYFMETLYCLKDSLLINGPSDQADAYLELLLGMLYTNLTEAVKATALEVQWAEINAPAHIIEVALWLGTELLGWNSLADKILLAIEKLGGSKANVTFFIFFNTIKRFKENPDDEEQLWIIVEGQHSNERKATLLLLLIRRRLAEGNTVEARRLANRMPEEGAWHLSALANRLVT